MLQVIEDLIRREQISIDIMKVVTLEDPGAGIEHYICQLSRPGKQMDAFLSVDEPGGAPTVPDVMFMLLMDASGCRILEGFEEFRNEWIEELSTPADDVLGLDEFQREYRSRLKQVEELRDFLGEPVYESVLHQFALES